MQRPNRLPLGNPTPVYHMMSSRETILRPLKSWSLRWPWRVIVLREKKEMDA
jgi:hypothetical protein